MKKRLLLFMAVASMFVGCSKINLDDAMSQSVGTGLAVPIGTLDVTVFDLYNNFDSLSELKFDEDNTIFLYWMSPIKIDEFDIKDFSTGQRLVTNYSLMDDPVLGPKLRLLPEGMTLPLPDTTFLITDTLKYKFNFNEASDTSVYSIDSILVRQAKILLGIDMLGLTLDDNTYLEAEITFPTLVSVKPIVINALATASSMDFERHIGNFLARFDDSDENAVEMNVLIRLVSDGTKSITKDAGVRLETAFEDIEYSVIKGYIYQSKPISANHTSITLPNTEMLAEFLEKNIVSLYNPEFSITLTNNLGVDALLNVNEIYTMGKSGKRNAIFRGGEKSFTQTIRTPQEPGDTATTTITLDRNFGQTNELFKEIPDSMMVDWELYIGNAGGAHNNFIVDPIQLDAEFSVRVPIWFDKGTYINFDDTIEADLKSINGEWTNYVNMKTFHVFLDFTNTLPVNATARIAFLDSIGNELYAQEGIEIQCPKVDEMGRSVEMAHNEEMIEFPQEAIPNIIKTKKIAMTLLIDGYDEQSTINFHATDGIRVKVSAYANMTLTAKKKD